MPKKSISVVVIEEGDERYILKTSAAKNASQWWSSPEKNAIRPGRIGTGIWARGGRRVFDGKESVFGFRPIPLSFLPWWRLRDRRLLVLAVALWRWALRGPRDWRGMGLTLVDLALENDDVGLHGRPEF
jgi:hypothetical protein